MNMECKHHNTCLNIIFDLFGVLVTTEWESVVTQILCSDKELTPLFMLFFKSENWANYQKGVLNSCELEAFLPPQLPRHLLQKLMREMPLYAKPITEMVDLLTLLKNRGHNLYLLTNVIPDTYLVFEQRFSFFQLFNGRLSSFSVKALKPEIKIYQSLLARYSLDASTCLFIDNKRENVVAAQNLGIDGIFYENYATTYQELKSRKLV